MIIVGHLCLLTGYKKLEVYFNSSFSIFMTFLTYFLNIISLQTSLLMVFIISIYSKSISFFKYLYIIIIVTITSLFFWIKTSLLVDVLPLLSPKNLFYYLKFVYTNSISSLLVIIKNEERIDLRSYEIHILIILAFIVFLFGIYPQPILKWFVVYIDNLIVYFPK